MAVTKEQSIAEIPKFDNSPILDKAFIVSNISLLSDINAVISLNYLSSNTAMWKIHMIFTSVMLMVVD